jgi:hypothetical protein
MPKATLHELPAQGTGIDLRATAGTPRPWTCFRCRGRSPGSQVAVVPCLPNAGSRVSDVKIGSNSLLTVAGAAPDSSREIRDSPASLLATKSCDVMDRDAYIWCYSPWPVNGPRKISIRLCKGCENHAPQDVHPGRVDAHTALPISERVVVLRERNFPELRGKPVRRRSCPRNCKRRAAVQPSH